MATAEQVGQALIQLKRALRVANVRSINGFVGKLFGLSKPLYAETIDWRTVYFLTKHLTGKTSSNFRRAVSNLNVNQNSKHALMEVAIVGDLDELQTAVNNHSKNKPFLIIAMAQSYQVTRDIRDHVETKIRTDDSVIRFDFIDPGLFKLRQLGLSFSVSQQLLDIVKEGVAALQLEFESLIGKSSSKIQDALEVLKRIPEHEFLKALSNSDVPQTLFSKQSQPTINNYFNATSQPTAPTFPIQVEENKQSAAGFLTKLATNAVNGVKNRIKKRNAFTTPNSNSNLNPSITPPPATSQLLNPTVTTNDTAALIANPTVPEHSSVDLSSIPALSQSMETEPEMKLQPIKTSPSQVSTQSSEPITQYKIHVNHDISVNAAVQDFIDSGFARNGVTKEGIELVIANSNGDLQELADNFLTNNNYPEPQPILQLNHVRPYLLVI
jgi:hypothetical protein